MEHNGSESKVWELRDYLAVVRGRRWLVISAVSITVVAAMLYSWTQTPMYQAEARVLVRPVVLSPVQAAAPQAPNLETESELVSSIPVARIAANTVNHPRTRQLLEGLSVSVETDTEILVIHYSSAEPSTAQARANAFAAAYLDYRRQQALDDLLSASQSVRSRVDQLQAELNDINAQIASATRESDRYRLQTRANSLVGQLSFLQQRLADFTPPESLDVGDVVQPAELPESPASPNFKTNFALALFLGLTFGIGLVFLRERLDSGLRSRSEFESEVRAPVLAVIPRVRGKRRQQNVITLSEPKSVAAEAYRTLRTALLHATAQHGMKTILITSATANEGKTMTAANIGAALARAGKRVVLVGADLRRPRLATLFHSSRSAGITTVIAGGKLEAALMQTRVPGLMVLPAGPSPSDPAELLASPGMWAMLDEIREMADFVLIDAPPLLAVADALVLAPMADGVLFVADASKTGTDQVAHARHLLDQVDGKVIGAVLNKYESKGGSYGYGYGYGYRDKKKHALPFLQRQRPPRLNGEVKQNGRSKEFELFTSRRS